MKNEIIELNEKELATVRGGSDIAYGTILATAGIAAVGGAFVLTAAPVLLVGLGVVGAAAFLQGAWFGYRGVS